MSHHTSFNHNHTRAVAAPWRQGLRLGLLAMLTFLLALAALYAAVVLPVLAGDADSPLQATYYGSCADVNGLGVVAAGAGLDGFGVTSSTLTLTVPGTVISAWVYYNGADDGNQPGPDPNLQDGDEAVTFNGNPISGTRIGGPVFWDGTYWSYAYKADVTSYVTTGTGVYTLGDVDAFDIYQNGWELVVLYADSARAPHAIAIAEGLDVADGTNSPSSGPGIEPLILSFDPAAVPRTADLATIAGGILSGTETAIYYEIGYGTPPITISYDIYTGTLLATNPFQRSDGDVWDTYTDTITVPASATHVIIQPRYNDSQPAGNPDGLEWVVQTLQLPEACPEVECCP